MISLNDGRRNLHYQPIPKVLANVAESIFCKRGGNMLKFVFDQKFIGRFLDGLALLRPGFLLHNLAVGLLQAFALPAFFIDGLLLVRRPRRAAMPMTVQLEFFFGVARYVAFGPRRQRTGHSDYRSDT